MSEGPQSHLFDRNMGTPRRIKAVEKLIELGYLWHNGEWITRQQFYESQHETTGADTP